MGDLAPTLVALSYQGVLVVWIPQSSCSVLPLEPSLTPTMSCAQQAVCQNLPGGQLLLYVLHNSHFGSD